MVVAAGSGAGIAMGSHAEWWQKRLPDFRVPEDRRRKRRDVRESKSGTTVTPKGRLALEKSSPSPSESSVSYGI